MKKKIWSGVLAAAVVFGANAASVAPMFSTAAMAENTAGNVALTFGDWGAYIWDDHAEISYYYGTNTAPEIPLELSGKPVTVLSGISTKYSTDSETGLPIRGTSTIEKMIIPKNIQEIDDHVFKSHAIQEAPPVVEIVVDNENPVYSSEDGVLFDKDKTTLITCPAKKGGALTIPESVKAIEFYAFFDCFLLEDIYYSGTKAQWENMTNNNLYIPDKTVIHCTDGTIGDKSAEIMPDGSTGMSISQIGDWEVYVRSDYIEIMGYTGSQSVVEIPQEMSGKPVKVITGFYFTKPESSANIKGISLPSTVESIDWQAFLGCPALEEITVSDENNDFSSENGILFNKDKTILIACPKGKAGSYNVPDSVTSIENSAFMGCTSLNNITLPDSVTEIGYNAFSECSSLEKMTIPNGVEYITSRVFCDCTKLTEVSIPNSVTMIDDSVFLRCSNLAKVNIPDNVKSIGWGAFGYCDALKTITIPESVEYISDGAFFSCPSLTEINVSDSNSEYCSVDGVLFNKDKTRVVAYPGGKAGAYTVPDSVSSILGQAFSGCEKLTAISLPENLEWISYEAFENCTALSEITIPDNVVEIRGSAFMGCSALAKVTLPKSLVDISSYLFSGCTSLTSIKIPEKVESIGWDAFEDCTSLAEITIPVSVTFIDESAFDGCDALKDIYYDGTEAQWNEIDKKLPGGITVHFASSSEESKPEESKPEESKPEVSDPEDKPALDPGYSNTSPSTPSTPSSSSTTTTTPASPAASLEDKATGVELEAAAGVLPEGTELKVEPSSSDSGDEATFEITLVKDGKEVQPDGKVTVKIPVPEKLKDAKELFVYRVEGKKYIPIACKVENGLVIFDTDHFSTYVVSAKKLGEAAPATGIALAAAPAALAAAFVAVSAVIKKKK